VPHAPRSGLSSVPSRAGRGDRPYHHPNLRQALIDAALELLRAEGPGALTLRGVARVAGVSQTAPYRHFPDRAALVAAVADDGFRRLHARMRGAEGAGGGPGDASQRAALRQLGLAYVRFGLDHPAEYRIMFGPEAAPRRDDGAPPPSAAREAVYELLTRGIIELQQRRVIRAGDPGALAMSCWAMMHGIVMLSLDGRVAQVGRRPDELAEGATMVLMHGMARPY
jgi:AcrR family transcriptional regulator